MADVEGETALSEAVRSDQVHIAKVLLDNGASPRGNGVDPMLMALDEDDVDMVIVFSTVAWTSTPETRKETPLYTIPLL